MDVETMPKTGAVTLSIRVPKELQHRFSEAARIISEVYPNKPVLPADLMSFSLFKETTGGIVIEFLEWVQNCDDSLFEENGSDRHQPSPKSRSQHD
jgi:hypothetical protein